MVAELRAEVRDAQRARRQRAEPAAREVAAPARSATRTIPRSTNATIYLAPGESAKITLRVFDPTPHPGSVVTVTNADGTHGADLDPRSCPNEDVTPVVQQQSVNTEDVEDGVTEPPIVVQFPAPQTVPTPRRPPQNTPVTFNVLANDSTAFGSTKVISFHPGRHGRRIRAAAPGDIAYQPSTGFLYTQRGAVDPVTNTLVGRFAAAARRRRDHLPAGESSAPASTTGAPAASDRRQR